MQITPAKGVNIKAYGYDLLANKLWRVTEKVDGVRRLFHKRADSSVVVYSSSGKIDKWLGHICEFLSAPWFPSDIVYDCELVDRALYFARVESFLLRTETIGKASQQYSDNKQDLIALCFDMYRPGTMADGYFRDNELRSLFDGQLDTNPMLMVSNFGPVEGDDITTITDFMDCVVKQNGEGLMLMDMSEPYIPGRSKALVKIKKGMECIGEILDYELGGVGTKIEGGVASLICKVPGCTVNVRVGSGLTNQERYSMAAMGNDLLGKMVEIDAFSKSKDHQGNVSLSLPIFKRLLGGQSDG